MIGSLNNFFKSSGNLSKLDFSFKLSSQFCTFDSNSSPSWFCHWISADGSRCIGNRASPTTYIEVPLYSASESRKRITRSPATINPNEQLKDVISRLREAIASLTNLCVSLVLTSTKIKYSASGLFTKMSAWVYGGIVCMGDLTARYKERHQI